MKLVSKKRMLSTLYALLDQLPCDERVKKSKKEIRRKMQASEHIKHLVIRASRSNTEKELKGHFRYVYNELLRRAKASDSSIHIVKVVAIGNDGILHLHCTVFCTSPIDSLLKKPLKRCWIDEQKGTTKNLEGLIDYIYDKNLMKSLSRLQKRFAIRKFITLPIEILFNSDYILIGERTDNVRAIPKPKQSYKLLTATTCIVDE